jgi:hypothetical protein
MRVSLQVVVATIAAFLIGLLAIVGAWLLLVPFLFRGGAHDSDQEEATA